jgi:DivIVA domain-containing protein
MDISPQKVRTVEFKTAKRGLDPDEVRSFLNEVAGELERAQNQSTAMEARARAAVARLQEMSEGSGQSTPATGQPDTTVAAPSASVDESETISRTLLLAQRTADTAVAEAEAEAEKMRGDAVADAAKAIESARETSAKLIDEARSEARVAGDAEKAAVQAEVEALRARRDFLESDVDHLEGHLTEERSRLREAATTLLELTERVPGGLGQVRRPLLSASDDDSTDDDSTDEATENAADGAIPAGADGTTEDLAEPIDGDDDDSGDDSDQQFAFPDDATHDPDASANELDETAPLIIQTDIADESDQRG